MTVDVNRTEHARAQDHRGQRALDALTVGDERQRRLDLGLQVFVSSEAPQRTQRSFDQLGHLTRLLVEQETAGLDARDFEHLFEKGVKPLRLPLQHLDVARVGGLALLQTARERIGKALDAGERRLQLVRRHREESVLARLALRGRQHRSGSGEQRLERPEVAQAALETE